MATFKEVREVLTEREKEVLGLVLEGKSNREVADLLCCSKRTVDFHLAKIYKKLDVSNRIQAMRVVAPMGIIPSLTLVAA